MIARRGLLLAFALVAPAAAQPATSLVGPTWILLEMEGAAAPAEPRVSLVFTAEGHAQGSGGCNRFTGGYAPDGAALRFQAVARTMMACTRPAMDLEEAFHRAIGAVRGWRIEAGALLLADAAGATLLRFTPEG